MKDRAKTACVRWLATFLRSRAGSITPLFAIAAIPLIIAIGSATDVGRMMDVRSQLQDMSDSAALAGATKLSLTDSTTGVTLATNFLRAAVQALPGSPTLQATASCTGPTATTTNVVVASICVPAYVTSGTSVTATIQVMLVSKLATTFAAIVVPSVPVGAQATAQGNVGRQATFSINNFNSSAYDLDQIYYYIMPTSMSGVTGASLYKYVPALPTSNLILSNAPGFTNTSQTISIGYGDSIQFAMSNTTGGRISYSPNCYGSTPSTPAKIYYSHRTTQPTTTTTQYYDYNADAFKICVNTSVAAVSVSPDTYYQFTQCSNGSGCYAAQASVGAGANLIYPWGYSRNPLQFGVLNRNSSGIPTGGTTTSTNSDCTKGDVTYDWDDNGGGSDDSDFNDIVFTVNCQATMVQQSSIKLVN